MFYQVFAFVFLLSMALGGELYSRIYVLGVNIISFFLILGSQLFKAVYISNDGNAGCKGVVRSPGGAGNAQIPLTMAMWFRQDPSNGIGSSLLKPGLDCSDILKRRVPTALDGIYFIQPAGYSSAIQVYCDMSTNGGGWTLVGYAANAALGGLLTVSNGIYSPASRIGSANINALTLARNSTEMAISWSNAVANDNITSYQSAVSFRLPSPSTMTLTPTVTTGATCTDSSYSLVAITILAGSPGLPSSMYTRSQSLGVCYGHTYGLVATDGSQTLCDWSIDGQMFKAVYISNYGTSNCKGVIQSPGGSANVQIPLTMAIWFRNKQQV